MKIEQTSPSASVSPARYWPYLLLAGITLLYFYPFLLGKTLCMRDTFFDYYPWRAFARGAFHENTIPLWNPYSSCGKPFIANPQSAFFYPPHLIFMLLPMRLALPVSTVVHLFLAAVFMFLLMRRLGLGERGALLSGVVFAFGGLMASMIEYMAIMNCLVWVPLVLLLLDRAMARPTVVAMWALALVIAIQYLSGFPQTMYFGLIAAAAWWAARLLSGSGAPDAARARQKRFATLLVGCGLALGLAGVQFCPTLELLSHSVRAQGLNPELDQTSLHPFHLLTLLFPFLFGRPGYPDQFWAQGISEFWLGSVFLGVIPLIFCGVAIAAAFHRAPGREAAEGPSESVFAARYFLFLGAVALLIAMGKYTPVYMWLHESVPLFNRFRWPTKILPLFALAGAALAGIGLDLFLRRLDDTTKESTRYLKGIVTGVGVGLGIMVLLLLYVALDPLSLATLSGGRSSLLMKLSEQLQEARRSEVLAASLRSVVFALLGAGAVVCAWRGKLRSNAFSVVILSGTFLDLWIAGRPNLLFATPDVYESRPATVARLEEEAGFYRAMSPLHFIQQFLYGSRDPSLLLYGRSALAGDAILPDRIFKEWGGDALRIGDYERYHTGMAGSQDRSNPAAERFRDMASVRYLVESPDCPRILFERGFTGREVRLAARETAWPRASFVVRYQVVSDREAMFRRFVESDGRPRAFLEGPPEKTPDQSASGRVTDMTYALNRTAVEVSSKGDGLLLLNDTFYPGWRVYVDGRRELHQRANWCFRALSVSEGDRLVEFVFSPRSFVIGLYLSLLCVAGAAFSAGLRWRLCAASSG